MHNGIGASRDGRRPGVAAWVRMVVVIGLVLLPLPILIDGQDTRGAARAAEFERPQTPQPPFPYRAEEVTYDNGAITLAGTLTLPAADAPYPAVLLLTGSGPQDRDETIFGHKPFLVLADFLTRAGIAVLRVDDRGVGGSSAGPATATSADLADDAVAGVRFLTARPEIDSRRIGLIGHSEGGIIAARAARQTSNNDKTAEAAEVAFVVLLAGPGVPGDKILPRQLAAMSLASGANDDFVQRQRTIQKTLLTAIKTGAPEDETRGALRELIQLQSPTLVGTPLDNVVRMQLQNVTSPWFRFFLNHDPRDDLRHVTVPVLALNGSKDLQVLWDQNLPAIEAALAEAGNDDVTVRRLDGLNHLFQTAAIGTILEYGALTVTVAPLALTGIRDWIVARFGD